MHILVDAANYKYFLIVSNWLTSVEFLRLFERALHAFDLSILCIKNKAVTNPSIVTSKDHDLRVIKREAAHSVPCRPVVLPIHKAYWLPSLLVKLQESIKSLNLIQWLLIHRVSSANHIKVAVIKHTN